MGRTYHNFTNLCKHHQRLQPPAPHRCNCNCLVPYTFNEDFCRVGAVAKSLATGSRLAQRISPYHCLRILSHIPNQYKRRPDEATPPGSSSLHFGHNYFFLVECKTTTLTALAPQHRLLGLEGPVLDPSYGITRPNSPAWPDLNEIPCKAKFATRHKQASRRVNGRTDALPNITRKEANKRNSDQNTEG